MSNGQNMQNPGRKAGASVQSSWRLVALGFYRIGLAGANALLPFLPVAVEGALRIWGGLR
jgi:hypothetical protein